MELCDLALSDAAQCLRDGDVSAEEYGGALLAQYEAKRSLNAFIAMDPERVLGEARKADLRRRKEGDVGPLHGVPIAIKDAFDVAGTPTTAGTPRLRDNLPPRTAPALQALFQAGAMMLGKTNLPELCFAVTGNNDFTGSVRNPYDPNLSPGGSSAGTATAVAARMAPAGIGSDTSGSVRIPAAFCGLFGYRPSTGRYPSGGAVPMNHSRDTLGFMARSAADIALLDEICTGEAVGESPRLADLRIGVPTDYFFTDVDDRIAAVIDAELARLRDLGVELIEAQAPDFATARSQTTGPIMVSEFRDDLRNYLEEVGADLSVDALVTSIASPYVRRELEQIFSAASPEMAQRYERAIFEVMPRHRAEYLTYLRNNDLDAIALPTAPLLPGPVDENEKTTLNGQEVSIWQTLRNAVPASILGAPGLTLPVGMTRDGLPVGLELDGAPGGDKELLALGLAWERCSTHLSSP